ncbi:MAG: ClbS/DfsB family four-helix bundle protein [Anaerolineales bacterium]|nr:ClbS/DfsB family four-helix bundle protein [Anaerolineales bacterium]
MQQRRFLAILQAERAQFEALLAAVGHGRMAVPGVSGFYSTKDIVAHLDAYDRALVTWLNAAADGRVYVDPVLDQPDLDARNAMIYAANKDRAAAEVLAAFRQTLDELAACIATLSDDVLTDAERTAWFVVPRWQRPQPLWQCIANDSYEHHQQHAPDIARWLAAQENRPDTGKTA